MRAIFLGSLRMYIVGYIYASTVFAALCITSSLSFDKVKIFFGMLKI